MPFSMLKRGQWRYQLRRGGLPCEFKTFDYKPLPVIYPFNFFNLNKSSNSLGLQRPMNHGNQIRGCLRLPPVFKDQLEYFNLNRDSPQAEDPDSTQ